jgi:hypothetical protein
MFVKAPIYYYISPIVGKKERKGKKKKLSKKQVRVRRENHQMARVGASIHIEDPQKGQHKMENDGGSLQCSFQIVVGIVFRTRDSCLTIYKGKTIISSSMELKL